ncbi:MAG: hypothetical protein A2283_02895 [Lentisphaerae bacterium RIFOXYA12_FULL_48_11]|nr:MAG: hypothetical protein A2283_02895 [Lentisphaerae bacterium RIFOXYA12_FULL_48_11]
MTTVLVPLADGVEEIEAVIPIDMFRRAGWMVVSAGMTGEIIRASRDVRLVADKLWKDIVPSSFDILLLPGGSKGTEFLAASNAIIESVTNFFNEDKIVAAICAAPLILQKAGIMKGKKATCHPAVRKDLNIPQYVEAPVVVDGKIVTSMGAGTAFEFSLTIIEMVDGSAKADEVASGIVL